MARRKRYTGYYKTVLLAVSLGLLFITGFVGAGLASAEINPLGFILLGVGVGGFALIIVGSIITVSLMQRCADKKAAAPRLTATGGFGKVTDVRVDPDSCSDALGRSEAYGYIIKVRVNDNTPEMTFTCKKRHQIGDTVEFVGKPDIPSTLRLCPHCYDD